MTQEIVLDNQQDGSVIVSILVIMIFLTSLIFSSIILANANLRRAKSRILLLETQYAAESGADSVIATLNNSANPTTGVETTVLSQTNYKATFTVISVSAGATAKEKVIKVTGKVYAPASLASANYTRTIEVTAQQSSQTTSTSILSRNIISITSGVKNVNAVDIYANGYIDINKDTTNLIAENITVADRNVTAANCSIGGAGGTLLKPASFTHVGQTKTNITIAYNNCFSPPGNTSNANFNVLANQNSISKIQSSYIPWSYIMDGSYQNAPSGCTDWTTGASPRSIPSTGNTKKTHYPDSASGVSASCGTNGGIALGSSTYTIKDNAHIRASLCAAAACTPTFNNTSGSTAFIFVEGTINFDSLTTTAGSSPIIFVAYGADTGLRTGACPYGDAVYLGKNGNTIAPKIYLIAMNGLCLEKTKFGAANSLGGVSGKNIFVDTNPGTPFDLALDPTFPTNQIPVDLSWRAIRYRRV